VFLYIQNFFTCNTSWWKEILLYIPLNLQILKQMKYFSIQCTLIFGRALLFEGFESSPFVLLVRAARRLGRVWSIRLKTRTGQSRSIPIKTCPIATLLTVHTTRTGQGSNPPFRDKRTPNNRLNNRIALKA